MCREYEEMEWKVAKLVVINTLGFIIHVGVNQMQLKFEFEFYVV